MHLTALEFEEKKIASKLKRKFQKEAYVVNLLHCYAVSHNQSKVIYHRITCVDFYLTFLDYCLHSKGNSSGNHRICFCYWDSPGSSLDDPKCVFPTPVLDHLWSLLHPWWLCHPTPSRNQE